MTTLSREGRATVQTEREKFILMYTNDEEVYSGNLFLKVILIKAMVDNKSGAYEICMELIKLLELMERINLDISKFNERENPLLVGLTTGVRNLMISLSTSLRYKNNTC
jgi:hypothetical protein